MVTLAPDTKDGVNQFLLVRPPSSCPETHPAGTEFDFSTQSLISHPGSCWRPDFLMHFTGNQEKIGPEQGRGETCTVRPVVPPRKQKETSPVHEMRAREREGPPLQTRDAFSHDGIPPALAV